MQEKEENIGQYVHVTPAPEADEGKRNERNRNSQLPKRNRGLVMSLRQSTGMKAVWGLGMIILAILAFMYLGSVSYMFDAQTFRLLQYLVTVFGFMSILVIW